MNLIDRERHDVMVRVRDFGATYGHLFPESSLAPQAFAVVTNAIDEIDASDVAEKMASVLGRATRKRRARETLEGRLHLIARTARVLGGEDAEAGAHFEVPDGGSDQVLITVARQCVQWATPLAAQFVAHGMPSGFLGELQTLVEALEEALRDRGMGRDRRVAARTVISEALTGGFKAIRQLDVIVANHLTANPAACEVWNRGRRIRNPYKSRRQPPSTQGTDASPPAPVAPPSPESATT